MTEASGPITDDEEVTSREGSVGRVIQGCIVKVRFSLLKYLLFQKILLCLLYNYFFYDLTLNFEMQMCQIYLKRKRFQVVDPDTEKILSYNEPGEVYIKGPVVFEGYVGRDNKNDFDRDGFYRTGDIAYYDEDGYFYIIDRIKELIKYKGWQVRLSSYVH